MSTPGWTNSKMNPWKPDDDAHQARRIGKTGEEVNELGTVLFRISIQGMMGIDPKTGKTNRQWWIEEMADVYAQIECNLKLLTVAERHALHERVHEKIRQMNEWEDHYK